MSMGWEEPWSRAAPASLARYVSSNAVSYLRLEINRTDHLTRTGDRRSLVAAIYNALLDCDIRYCAEKGGQDYHLQRIRAPHEILGAPGEGTCLDLAALFCGLCLGNDLLPLLIVLHGHAIAAVSLQYASTEWDASERLRERALFDKAVLKDPVALAQVLDIGDYLAVECTGFAQSEALSERLPEGAGRSARGTLSFERALRAGQEQLDHPERGLDFALDIAALHEKWNLPPFPLPSPSTRAGLVIRDRKRKRTLNDIQERLPEALKEDGGKRNIAGRDRLRRVTGELQQLLLDAEADAQRGQPPPADLPDRSADVIRQLTRFYPPVEALHVELARLRGTLGDYPQALEDLKRAVRRHDAARSEHLMLAGTLLLNLCEFERARRLFRLVESALTQPESPGLWTPLENEARLGQLLSVKQFGSLWIPDYQGNYAEVFKEGGQLITLARSFSVAHEAGVQHRLGRSMLTLGMRQGDRDMMARGANALRRARNLIGDRANPFIQLWDYRAAEALHAPDADRYWNLAVEASQGWGEGIEAHRCLLEGRRRRRQGKFLLALDPLERALSIWARNPYPRGVCEAFCELGLVHSERSGSMADQLLAARYFRAAEGIAETRHTPLLGSLQGYRNRSLERAGCTLDALNWGLEELVASYPRAFQRYSYADMDGGTPPDHAEDSPSEMNRQGHRSYRKLFDN
jgi:hypothetical protein